MRNKKEQIPVQRLYMDRNQNRYKNIIWITFLALLLTGGTFLVIRESWKGQLSALPVCILTAGAGILCCVLAEIMRERIRFVTAIAGLPWIVLLVFTGAFRGGWTGAQAWINILISQWNTANAGGLALFSVQASMHDAFIFTLILVLAVAEISWFLADGRHLLLANIFCILWVILQLLCGVLNPAACGFLFAALCGMCVSDDEMIFTRNRAGWTVGVLIVFCIFGRVVSEEEILAVSQFRESVQEEIHKIRYGEDTLPEGNLYLASELKADAREMLKLKTEQQKTLYLRGFVGSVYEDGVWEEPADAVYGGENAGMLGWLEENSFDPLCQISDYYAHSDEEKNPGKNEIQIRVTGASRYYVYTPAAVEDIKKGKLTEDKDIRFCNKGFFAARNYTIEETSGTRPAELMVTDPWVSTPESAEQKQYSETEAVYRAFVYDTYRDVDPETRDLVQQMFWDDYESDSDGIYSSICRIRDVLKENVEYTENIEEVPDGEDLVRYFLTGSQRGNAMLYASAAVDALRVHGIPARYVEGYYISESDLKNSQSEEIILTGENTHAWAEAYFDGIGWLPLDVTPGYYYDAVTLQKMVSTPDVAQKNAVLKDNSFGSQEVTGLDGAGGKSARERLTRAARDVGAICLGIVAVLLILFVVVIIVCEVIRNVCLWTDRKADRGASPREKILRTEKKIYSYLALVGIRARLGWNTEETDRLIADFFEEIESGEYTRVCNLIEKVIYGEIELEPHEERTVTSFLNKLLTSQKFMDRRAWLRRRYTYVWMNRK